MLTTKFKKGAKLLGVCIDDESEEVVTKIFFDDEADSDDENEDYIPLKRPRHMKEVFCDEGEHMEPFYNPDERVTMFIAGAQNCGKSYFIGQFLNDYREMHPRRPVYLLTGLTEKDKSLGEHRIRAIKMDEGTVGNLSLEKLRVDDKTGKRVGCLLIFDDVDRLRDKGLMKKVYDLLNDALCNGRDHSTQEAYADIDVIVTNHEINDYVRTKSILTECNYVVLFPYYSLRKQIDMVMDKIGISEEHKEKIRKYKGRAVVIHKVAPLYCVMKKEFFLLR